MSRFFTRKVSKDTFLTVIDPVNLLHYICVFIFYVVPVEDLLKYIDPQFTDYIAVPDAMKLEFILAGQ